VTNPGARSSVSVPALVSEEPLRAPPGVAPPIANAHAIGAGVSGSW
jgi:hypothetical protein